MGVGKFQKKRKKREMLPTPEKKDSEYTELEKNLMRLEYRFGFFSLKILEADIRMRHKILADARKRLKKGLTYRV